MNTSRRDVLRQGVRLSVAGGLMSTALGRLALGQATTAPATAPAKADPYIDAVFKDGVPPMPEDGSFTVVVLPDTQHYQDKYAGTFSAQTDWIVANLKDRRIAAVLHLGDITNNNRPVQWQTAREAMSRLDGKVPYCMVTGNHDYNDGKVTDRTTSFTENFPLKKFSNLGGVYDKEPGKIDNSFHTFSANGRDFLVICLEFGPRADVVRWANEIVAKYPKHEAILVTHAYVYHDSTRYDWKKYGTKQRWNPHGYPIAEKSNHDVLDGQELWDNLVSKHDNFILTLNGHVIGDGLGLVSDKLSSGRNVHQVLVNFQMKPNGGDGWLRLMEFKRDGSIQTHDYSPTLNRQNVAKENHVLLSAAKSA